MFQERDSLFMVCKKTLNLCHGTSKALESIKKKKLMKKYGPPKIVGQKIVKKENLKTLRS